MNKTKFNIVLIGAKSTGKTVYLTALSSLPFIAVSDKDTLNYLKPLRAQLKNRTIPATNAGYQELFFEYNKKNDFNLNFQIDDYDGKFVEQFSSEENAELKKKLENNIQTSEGMIFCLPYEENLDMQKAENIREEIDLFIKKVRELYPNKKRLPVPVSIVITKWDDSPDFKSSSENRKAKQYIENNNTLNGIKNKIESFFSDVTLIPISSFENYNLELPLEFCFKKTFASWEERIEQLKDNEFELICFLSKIINDIKFYKDAKYGKLYISLENKIFEEIFKKLENAQTIEEFEEIRDEFTLENGESVIDSLTETHQNKINQIEEYLLSIKSKENKKILFISAGVVALILGGFVWYKTTKIKDNNFAEIVSTAKNNNIKKSLTLIKEYKTNYGKDDEHYKEVVQIENKVYSKCQNNINNKLAEVKSLTSLKEKINNLKSINQESKLCNIPLQDISNLNKLYEDYNTLLSLVNSLSLENMNEEIVSQINTLLTNIKDYNEYNDIYSLLKSKINSISEDVLNSSNSEDTDKIIQIKTLISQLNIENPELINKLNSKYDELNAKLAYENFKNDLNSLEYPQAIDYINSNYKSSFENKNEEIKSILDKKFNSYIANIIDNAPSRISTESDLNVLRQKIQAIIELINNNLYLVNNYTPSLDANVRNRYINLQNLYRKYNRDNAMVNYIAFKADREENSPLGFSCDSFDNHDGNIELFIGKYHYSYRNYTSQCNNLTISWNILDDYKADYYVVKVIEKDTLTSDDFYPSNITLSKNDIISLINGERIDKNLGNGYHIIFGGAR